MIGNGKSGPIHKSRNLSPYFGRPKRDAPCGEAQLQPMKAFPARQISSSTERPTTPTRPIHGAVPVGEALLSAMRQNPALRRLAAELEDR